MGPRAGALPPGNPLWTHGTMTRRPYPPGPPEDSWDQEQESPLPGAPEDS